MTALLENLTRPGVQGFLVGDAWRIVVSGGPPGGEFAIRATHDGAPQGTTSYGKLDQAGSFVLSGTFTDYALGRWQEWWTVNGQEVSFLEFTVAPAPAGGQAGTAGGGAGTGDRAGYQPSSGQLLQDILHPPTVGGIPGWVLLGGAIATGILISHLTGGRSR